MQHPGERLVKVFALTGETVSFDWNHIDGFFARSSGKRSRWHFYKNPVTELSECDLCGKVSTPKKVHVRNSVHGWNWESKKDYLTPSKSLLCMGCWNKVRHIHNRERETDHIRYLLDKLKREIANERKNQDNRRTS